MSKSYKSISKGLQEAVDYSNGKKVAVKEYRPIQVDVKELRKRIGMSQTKFASSFGISLGTLRHWERGDRNPNGPALVLLNLLAKDPNTILSVLQEN